MDSAAISEKRRQFQSNSGQDFDETSGLPGVVAVAADGEIRARLDEILGAFPVKVTWVTTISDAANLLSREPTSICLSGFWMEDGTYKDLIKAVRRETKKLPVVLVAAPNCADEYRDYLAAMNAGAFDFVCYPYRKAEVGRILAQAILTVQQDARTNPS